MGSWNITIRGVGCHHNKGHASDANRMAAEFVQKLRAAGHSIVAASITYGGENDLREPTKYLDDCDAGEKQPRKPRCSHPIGTEACRLVEHHEGEHLPPVSWK